MADTPIRKIDGYWPITAAVWRNRNNEGKVWYSVTFERSYKDAADGTWKSTGSFIGDDLLLLQKVAELAHTEVYMLKASERVPGKEG